MKLFFFLFMSVSLAAQTVTVPVPQSMANINASLNNLNAGKLHYAGAWSSGTPYNQSDVVTYSGSTYVSLQGSNANQNPATASAYWSVFASTSSNGVPAGTFAAKPATCTPGSVYFATDAQPGLNLFGCTATNTYSLMNNIPGFYTVDGKQFTTIGAAWTACVGAGNSQCEIWDYNLPETMNSLPWTATGSENTSIRLHLGPGNLIICGAGCGAPFTFATGNRGIITGTGEVNDSHSIGTAIQAGSNFSNASLTMLGSSSPSTRTVFAAKMERLTVDCNNTVGCTGIENVDDQEQGGLYFVNVIRYQTYGMIMHGASVSNSRLEDVQINGCLSTDTNCAILPSTIPLMLSNTTNQRDLHGITVNPINAYGVNPQINLSSCTASSGVGTCITSTNYNSAYVAPGNYINLVNTGSTQWSRAFLIATTNGTNQFTVAISGTPGSISTGNINVIPSTCVTVCAGSSCVDGSIAVPTLQNFQSNHFEHCGIGIDVGGGGGTGQAIGVQISSATCAQTTMTCVQIENNSNIKYYNITGLSTSGSTYTLNDMLANPDYVSSQQYIPQYPIPTQAAGYSVQHNTRPRPRSSPRCSRAAKRTISSGRSVNTPRMHSMRAREQDYSVTRHSRTILSRTRSMGSDHPGSNDGASVVIGSRFVSGRSSRRR